MVDVSLPLRSRTRDDFGGYVPDAARQHLACEAMILQNDFYSWEVEYEEYVQHGDSSQFVNGVFVLMGLYSTDVEEVKV